MAGQPAGVFADKGNGKDVLARLGGEGFDPIKNGNPVFSNEDMEVIGKAGEMIFNNSAGPAQNAIVPTGGFKSIGFDAKTGRDIMVTA